MLPILIGVTFNAVFVALLEPAYRATIMAATAITIGRSQKPAAS